MNIEDVLNIKKGYKIKDKLEFKEVRDFIFNNGFPTNNFDYNLKSLVIDKNNNKNNRSIISSYDPVFNRIKGSNSGESFIHELFHMSSCNDQKKSVGIIGKAGFARSLNEGITDYYTQCVNNSYKCNYSFEVLFLESLNFMYPENSKKRMACYFKADSNKFFNLFEKDRDIIIYATNELDIYDIYKTSYKEKNDIKYEDVIDHLTNAFSIIINNGIKKDNNIAYDILSDFEDTVRFVIKKENWNMVIDSIENKIERGKKLC